MHIMRLNIVVTNTTALHIGSGRPGVVTDSGVVTTPLGEPFLPGSSLKGKLRSTAERLAPHLGLTACLLGTSPTDVDCCTDGEWAKENKDRLEDIRSEANPNKKRALIESVTCDVCRIFGSPVMASRLSISDGSVIKWEGIIQARDGVVIDRDSETTVRRLRFGYDVIPPGAQFQFSMELSDLDEAELALIGASLLYWRENLLLGGGTSRGLGRMRIESVEAWQVDLTKPEEKLGYLLHQEMQPISDWEALFQMYVDERLREVGSIA